MKLTAVQCFALAAVVVYGGAHLVDVMCGRCIRGPAQTVEALEDIGP